MVGKTEDRMRDRAREFGRRGNAGAHTKSCGARQWKHAPKSMRDARAPYESGSFMMILRMARKDLGLSGLVKKSAQLLAVRTNGTLI